MTQSNLLNSRATAAPPPDELVREMTYWLGVIGDRLGADRRFSETARDVISALVQQSAASTDKTAWPGITMADVRLIAGEGKLAANDVLAAVNAHIRHHFMGLRPRTLNTGSTSLNMAATERSARPAEQRDVHAHRSRNRPAAGSHRGPGDDHHQADRQAAVTGSLRTEPASPSTQEHDRG